MAVHPPRGLQGGDGGAEREKSGSGLAGRRLPRRGSRNPPAVGKLIRTWPGGGRPGRGLAGPAAASCRRSQEAAALVAGLSHPFAVAHTLGLAASFYLLRREGPLARERAETVMAMATEQGFPFWLAHGTIVRGGALAEQGQAEQQQDQTAGEIVAKDVVIDRVGFGAHEQTCAIHIGQHARQEYHQAIPARQRHHVCSPPANQCMSHRCH